MLVYGATGRSGLCVVESALAAGWRVRAFVRSLNKLDAKLPAALRAQVTATQGDLCDGAAVGAAVSAARPHAIVDCSSALPFGHEKGQPANSADRDALCRATLKALEADGRLGDCVLIIVGGQLFPEPGGTINSWGVACLAWVLRNLVMRTAWRQVEAHVRWLFEGTPPAFRFILVRMGYMVVEPSRGALQPEATQNNIQRGAASYCDVGRALVQLAGDKSRQWEHKALFFNYSKA